MSHALTCAGLLMNKVKRGILRVVRVVQSREGGVRHLAVGSRPQEMRTRRDMNPDSDQFIQFLRDLGVEMESENAPKLEAEPELTIFQQSRNHDVFYRLDLIEGVAQLRILYPESRGRLKLHVYLIQLSEHHPLFSAFTQFTRYEGSREFERERDVAAHHLLYAVGEMMKDLFWAGAEISHFPTEITVQKLI